MSACSSCSVAYDSFVKQLVCLRFGFDLVFSADLARNFCVLLPRVFMYICHSLHPSVASAS